MILIRDRTSVRATVYKSCMRTHRSASYESSSRQIQNSVSDTAVTSASVRHHGPTVRLCAVAGRVPSCQLDILIMQYLRPAGAASPHGLLTVYVTYINVTALMRTSVPRLRGTNGTDRPVHSTELRTPNLAVRTTWVAWWAVCASVQPYALRATLTYRNAFGGAEANGKNARQNAWRSTRSRALAFTRSHVPGEREASICCAFRLLGASLSAARMSSRARSYLRSSSVACARLM